MAGRPGTRVSVRRPTLTLKPVDDADFTFQLRFVVPRSRRLPFETERVALSEAASRVSIALAPAEKNTTNQDAQHVALVGSGFPNEEQALQAGDEWRSRLEHAFASMDILADFGERLGPRGGFAPDMLELMTNAAGVAQMNDVHGLMVYQSDLEPKFWRGEATGIEPFPVAAGFAPWSRRAG